MTKQEEIKMWIVRDRDLVKSSTLRHLIDDYFKKAVLENNDSFEIEHNPKERGMVIHCKNKPRDMLVYGVLWKEFNGN